MLYSQSLNLTSVIEQTVYGKFIGAPVPKARLLLKSSSLDWIAFNTIKFCFTSFSQNRSSKKTMLMLSPKSHEMHVTFSSWDKKASRKGANCHQDMQGKKSSNKNIKSPTSLAWNMRLCSKRRWPVEVVLSYHIYTCTIVDGTTT